MHAPQKHGSQGCLRVQKKSSRTALWGFCFLIGATIDDDDGPSITQLNQQHQHPKHSPFHCDVYAPMQKQARALSHIKQAAHPFDLMNSPSNPFIHVAIGDVERRRAQP
jgi:hypothetical protein